MSISFSTLLHLPKIELHVHLDTSLSYQNVAILDPTISEYAYQKDYVAPAKCQDLRHFLDFTEPALRLLQTAENLDKALRQLIRELKTDNVIYAEIRFAPLLHTRAGLLPDKVAEVVCNAVAAGSAETGVQCRLIFCALRHFSQLESIATVQLAKGWQSKGVVGIDLAGDEVAYSLEHHIPAFQLAREWNLPATAHAGEALGAESVIDVLDFLHPRRIGHGVRSMENPDLVNLLARNKIHLEICPGSNIQTGVFQTMKDHSVDRLYRAGVSLSINTDGRGLTATTLTQEYVTIRENFGWSNIEFLRTNRMALKAAFCDLQTKNKLLGILESGYSI
jgi:adenosine deaminase